MRDGGGLGRVGRVDGCLDEVRVGALWSRDLEGLLPFAELNLDILDRS